MLGHVLIVISLAVVAAILLGGLVVMAVGGEVAGRWSNRLMRYRVLAQAGAILLMLLVLYFTSQH